jgi:flavin-dependent dehydrogenase
MPSPVYDVVIVGASFSGLTLAHHLPSSLRVLVVDMKPQAGATVESTGLITSKTRDLFLSFFPIDRFITNPLTKICVVAPEYADYFISETKTPWIYQTDTRALVQELAATVPSHVTVLPATLFHGITKRGPVLTVEIQTSGQEKELIETRFLVGADGGRSAVAKSVPELDQNTKFLFGFEQVVFGNVLLGPNPKETIYHIWFGTFSLGYGGWLSPTTINGRAAIRLGLAKLPKDRGEIQSLLTAFREDLVKHRLVSLTNDPPFYQFGSLIPIGGAKKYVHTKNVLLIGDAAGLCGAFAADGIKGSLVSGKESALLIPRFLAGETHVFETTYREALNRHGSLLEYYQRQLFYRFVWDRLKQNRTFRALFDIIKEERDTFLEQFCDSKDKRTHLSRVILKKKHALRLIRLSWFVISDILSSLIPDRAKNTAAVDKKENPC